MANSVLPEHLQFHGQSLSSGCLSLTAGGLRGSIYLQHGKVVYAETDQASGLLAVFLMLTWHQPRVEWLQDVAAPRLAFEEDVDLILFRFAQMEDAGQTDEASIRAKFGAQNTGQGIQAQELRNYEVCFEVLNTEFAGFVFKLQKIESLVGRLDDCDIILPDPSVSGHHCRIFKEPSCIRVEDLGSTNGTFINGELITQQVLQVGDLFNIGAVSLRMYLKLLRRLDSQPIELSQVGGSVAPAPTSTTEEARKNATVKIDVSHIRTAHQGGLRVPKGPISWKNLEPSDKTQTKRQSIFGNLFKR